MSVNLEQLLTLAGKLDDAPGFDSPRERFRRFLREHVTTPQTARSLIEHAQHTPGEQHRRALQDLVAITGRFLGFEVTFGTYEPVSGALTLDGQWTSRGRLQVVVDVRSVHAADADSIDGLIRSVAAVASVSGLRTMGVCVIASQFASRRRLEEAIAALPAGMHIALLPLPSLLAIAELASAGGLSHEDVLRLIELPAADFVIELLQRNAAPRTAEMPAPAAEVPAPALPVTDAPGWWIASVVRDYATRPEEFLELVVGRRQIFGIAHGTGADLVAKHDWICFYVAGKGVVGRAQVASPADHKSIRDAHRFRQLLNMQEVTLHLGSPIAPDPATELRLRAAAPQPNVQALIRISRETFRTLSAPAIAAPPAVSERRSRRSE
jgi:hypothetical protein